MAKKNDIPQLWLIEDVTECYDVKTGKAIPYYTYVHKGWEPEAETVRKKDAEDATLEQLVELCDHYAECKNAHDYCGAHRLLGAQLYRSIGRRLATVVMREIAYRGGLHSMAGLCGAQDSYKDLGVGVGGHDWSGSFGE